MRCLIDRGVPEDDYWTGLLSLHIEGQEALLHEDFLHRLNLTSKMDAALRRKAAAELSDKKLDRSILDDLVTELRAEFCNSARNYYLFLIGGVCKHVTMTTNNVRGMACFDPAVMTEMPLDFATQCFSDLYRGFKMRGWVQGTSEQECRDEYIGVLSHLRGTKVPLTSKPDAFHDMVNILSKLPALKERKHIYHLFRKSCLCLTDKAPSLPVVHFGSARTDAPCCRVTVVVLPVQSFFAHLPQSVPLCTSDQSLEDYLHLSIDFFQTGLDTSYVPWHSVDYFGRSKIHKRLTTTHKTLLREKEIPRRAQIRPAGAAHSELSPFRPTRRVEVRTCFGSVSKSDVARGIAGLQGTSKKWFPSCCLQTHSFVICIHFMWRFGFVLVTSSFICKTWMKKSVFLHGCFRKQSTY